jgi:catechol 2,3-dioxygenase-like lactoylglutathione lyase family enzyme
MEKPAVAPSSTGQPWSLKMLAPLEPGIVCTDMERMLKFYTEIVGLKLVGDAETTPEMSTKFRATPHGYRIVRMQTPYGERIKLAQPKVPPAKNPIPEWVFQRGGISYITFIIDNVKAMVERLRANNVKLVSEEPVEVRKGVFAIFALDPEGNYVEFVEFPDIASYRPDLFKK